MYRAAGRSACFGVLAGEGWSDWFNARIFDFFCYSGHPSPPKFGGRALVLAAPVSPKGVFGFEELEGAEGVGFGGVGVGFGDGGVGFGGAGVGITLHFSVAGGGLVSSVPDMFTAWPDCPSGHSKVTLV